MVFWLVFLFGFFSAYSLHGNISVLSTSHDIPLLLGNLTSFATGFAFVIFGSLIKPDNFNFNITKQRIVVVEERVRALIKEDNDEALLKKRTLFGYKYGIIFTLVLVVIWPLPLFFSGYIFSFEFSKVEFKVLCEEDSNSFLSFLKTTLDLIRTIRFDKTVEISLLDSTIGLKIRKQTGATVQTILNKIQNKKNSKDVKE